LPHTSNGQENKTAAQNYIWAAVLLERETRLELATLSLGS
jgi:hypothetical protein